MFSYQELQVIDVVARRESFSAAAEELHKVPSAISYTVKLVEERLSVNLFERLHRQVKLTPAGDYFVKEARKMMKSMDDLRRQTQRVANGWEHTVSLALDNVVREDRVSALVRDFYLQFPNVELSITMEVFNGVWDALADKRVDLAIGATTAIPVGGNFAYREMGYLKWKFVVSQHHPLTHHQQPLREDELYQYPAITLEDTSRRLPKRNTWLFDNQRRLTVPNWYSAIQCFNAGLGIGVMPAHIAEPLIASGLVVEKELAVPCPDSPCCVAWNLDKINPPIEWLLNYLGDSSKLQDEWL
ncbi:LysR family transcriptional regulator [Vibrio sp. SS-MA-C1-2]|uniref:DNA-binding transcriptional activator PunR n=1 Tax=Vibrio sp. SS-MA-C1-2 TaxID=2908646 RepID=UPI001F1A7FFE|nr:DNA-binding transcriptional activator PunR [Vibrio sp. SS-MA-C1-2]UJF20000.1 LysR family transcriptional regulator [Vibrio sp. SS-MA-C1-2]